MKKVILALVTISMLACTKNTNQQQHVPIKADDIYTLSATPKTTQPAHYNQSKTLVDFKQSTCKTSTQLPDKILHKELSTDTLIIKIRSTQNCDAQYKGNLNFTDNNLNLSLQLQPKIVVRKNGQTDTIYAQQACDCVFYFTYTINHIRALPQTITLNGKIIN